MRIAGLDSALRRSGAGVLDGSSLVHAEAFLAHGDTHGQAFHEFRVWWRAFLVGHAVRHVAIEEPLRSDIEKTEFDDEQGDAFQRPRKRVVPMTTMQTLLGLYGVRGHAIEICHALNIPCVEVNNQEWRHVIHGMRRAPQGTKNTTDWWKQRALLKCQEFGWNVKSKDAAEGALIARWLYLQLNPLVDTLFEGTAA